MRVQVSLADGVFREEVAARKDGDWVPVAVNADAEGTTCLVPGSVRGRRLEQQGQAVLEESDAGGQRIVRTLWLMEDLPWVHVSTRLIPVAGLRLHAFVDRYRFLARPDWNFAPSVGGFIPDAQYKAPVVLTQAGSLALALVPDLARLDPAALKRCNHALRLAVPDGPILSVGFMPAYYKYHSVYAEKPAGDLWAAAAPVENAYYLLATATAPPREAYREVVRRQWLWFGRPAQRSAARQQVGTPTAASEYGWRPKFTPIEEWRASDRRLVGLGQWDHWRREVWDVQSRREWLTLSLPGGAAGGGVPTYRWGPGPSLYCTAWFNTMRTSFGMALYARRTGKSDLLRLAGETVGLVLHAPGTDGAFKCVAAQAGAGRPLRWAAGDGSGESTEAGFLGYDMSWTGYWLLRWRAAGLPSGGGILARCEALANFMVSRQSADGMLPTRFAENGGVNEELSRTVKAETGPVALFLLELYQQDRDPRWLAAAERGLSFLEASVIPLRQWYDFETFWSCSPRGPTIDPETRQWPANDLALGQTVGAFFSAFRATGERRYRDQGIRLLDYLLLYQQCWTNPLLKHLSGPQMLLGGFTTQNSDAEWSDARQSQDGTVLLEAYRLTGAPEYLERGVAALRAQFPISPSENWAHPGYGDKSGISSFHWGTGSGMAGIEIEEDFLHDAAVDVPSGRAVGVNGIDVTQCVVEDGAIRLEYASPFVWTREPVFTFHGCAPQRRYAVYAQGTRVGDWSGAQLAAGIALPNPRPD